MVADEDGATNGPERDNADQDCIFEHRGAVLVVAKLLCDCQKPAHVQNLMPWEGAQPCCRNALGRAEETRTSDPRVDPVTGLLL